MNKGARYQAEVGAYLATLALAEDQAQLHPVLGASGSIVRIGVEQAFPLDDIVLWLSSGAKAFAQVKSSLNAGRSLSSEFGRVVDQVVRQYIHGRAAVMGDALTDRDRLLIIVGDRSSRSVTQDMREALELLRTADPSEPPTAVARGRTDIANSIELAIRLTREAFAAAGQSASAATILDVLRLTHVIPMSSHEIVDKATLLLSHVILTRGESSSQAFSHLVTLFSDAATKGGSLSVADVRAFLQEQGFPSRAATSIADDVRRLEQHTDQTLAAEARTIQAPDNRVVVRRQVADVIERALRVANVIVTAEAGAGKSGVLIDVAKSLREAGERVVFIDATDRSMASPTEGFNLSQPFETILEKWGLRDEPSYLLIDGFDSMRIGVAFDTLIRLLRRLATGAVPWRIAIASRQYDLIAAASQLTRLFPVTETQSIDSHNRDERFSSLAHVVVREFSDEELKEIQAQSPALGSMLDSNPELTDGLFRNPFNLSVGADLLAVSGETPNLSGVRERIDLLDLWWDRRITSDGGSLEREATLRFITQAMIRERALRVGVSTIADTTTDLGHLLSSGVLVAPDHYHQTIAFRHALLFDYAAYRLLLSGDGLQRELRSDRDAFLFILPSIRMRLERVWHTERPSFFEAIKALFEGEVPQRRTLLLIIAGIMFSSIKEPADAAPLLNSDDDAARAAVSSLIRTLIYERQHGVAVLSVTSPWPGILLAMSALLPRHMHDTLLLLSELLSEDQGSGENGETLSVVARRCLEYLLSISDPPLVLMRMAIGAFFKTYDYAPAASLRTLERLLRPERLAQRGYLELDAVGFNIDSVADPPALTLIYDAVFSDLSAPDEKIPIGAPSSLLSLVQDARQVISSARWSLGKHYASFLHNAPREATNALVRIIERRAQKDNGSERVLEIPFSRDVARMYHDASQIWDSSVYEHEDWYVMTRAFEDALTSQLNIGEVSLFDAMLEALLVQTNPMFLWRLLIRHAGKDSASANKISPLLESDQALLSYELREPFAHFLSEGYAKLDKPARVAIDCAIARVARSGRNDREIGYHHDLAVTYVRGIPRESLSKHMRGILSEVDDRRGETPDARREMILRGSMLSGVTTSRIPVSEELRDASASEETVAIADEAQALFYGDQGSQFDADAVIALVDRLYASVDGQSQPIRLRALALMAAIIRIAFTNNYFDQQSAQRVADVLLEAVTARVDISSDDLADLEARFAEQPSWGSPDAQIDATQALWKAYRLTQDRRMIEPMLQLIHDLRPAVRFHAVLDALATRGTDDDIGWILVRAGAVDANPSVVSAALRSAGYLAGSDRKLFEQMLFDTWDRLYRDPIGPLTKDLLGWLVDRVITLNDAEATSRVLTILDGPTEYPDLAYHLAFVLSVAAGSNPEISASTAASAYLRRLVEVIVPQLSTDLNELEGDVEASDERHERTLLYSKMASQIAERLCFSSGTAERETAGFADTGTISVERFRLMLPILERLADLPLSVSAYNIVQLLLGVTEVAPREALLLAARAIRNGARAGLASESAAESVVRGFVQRLITRHRGMLEQDRICLSALMDIIDTFVNAGWPRWFDTVFELDYMYRE
jgi:hypothetical protein